MKDYRIQRRLFRQCNPNPVFRRGLLLLTFGLLAFCNMETPPAFANLVVNGGFELPQNTPPSGYVTYFGGQSFPGWIVGGHSVDVHHTGHTAAYSGIQSLDVSGFDSGSISQMISTTPGTTYALSFAQAAHVYHPYVGDAMAAILWDGAVIDVIARPASPNIFNINWQLSSYFVTAISGSTLLEFVSLSPNGGVLLDDVSLTPVPEPSSLCVGISVVTLLVKLRMRRRGA